MATKGITEAREVREQPSMPAVVLGILFAAIIIVLGLLVWKLAVVLVLAFASIVVATVFVALAELIERFTPLSARLSHALSVLLIVSLAIGFTYVFGNRILAELAELIERLPEYLGPLGVEFEAAELRDRFLDSVQDGGMITGILGLTTNMITILTTLFLVVVAGVFLAASPATYREGLLMLVPGRVRPNMRRALNYSGNALKLWLVGQLILMGVIFVATTAGLFFLGVPSALVLGLIAGLLEFIPFIGPIAAAVPAVLIAVSEGGNLVFWVLALYLFVQQTESNVLIPFVQSRTVHLPPVLGLFCILVFSVLLGPIGLIMAVPLTVVLIVFVKQLYVRDMLGEQTSVPGEPKDEHKQQSEERKPARRRRAARPVPGPASARTSRQG